MLRVLYRADRALRPTTALPTRALKQIDGWCDASGDANCNGPVKLPYHASAELRGDPIDFMTSSS